MVQLGSDRGMASSSITGLNDATGVNVISTSNEFGASPLGIAARTQSLFGIPNSNFTLLPPDPDTRLLDNENALPYWSVLEDSEDRITATSTLNTTTNTWGVVLDPSSGTAIDTDTLTMTTRSYVITDDNLGVRQKAFLSMSKSGTAGGTASQWNITMQAEYFDALGASLSGGTPYVIGTALDTATFTTINGFTISGGSAIPAAAQYVDLSVILTATGTVTGDAKATLTSLLIQTSAGAAGAQSFVVAETFTSNATWTRPTGVEYLLAVVCAGAGGGGGSGGARYGANTTSEQANAASGGGGGGSGAWVYAQNFYIGDQTDISIGIGAAGTGGAGVGSTGTASRSNQGSTGAAGGATTFGTYITAGGGGGGIGGSAAQSLAGTVSAAGGAGGTANIAIFGNTLGTAAGAASGVNIGTASITAGTAGTAAFGTVTIFPYYPALSASTTGAAGTATGGGGGGTAANGATSTGAVGGGGGGGVGRAVDTNGKTLVTAGGASAGGSGPGGGGASRRNTPSVVVSSAGGNAAAYSSAGGGGSGGAAANGSPGSSVEVRSPKGGDGAAGFVVIAYVA